LKTLIKLFAGQGLDSGVWQSSERDFGQVQLPLDGGPEVLRHRKYGQTTGTKVKFYQTQKNHYTALVNIVEKSQ
jgi:hypothetical protein